MLTELTLENFKPFASKQTAELAPITLIYGPNSAGKSSLIQALLLMKQTIESEMAGATTLIPRGKYVDLGSFRALMHGHKIRNRSLSIGLRYTVDSRHRGMAETLRELKNVGEYGVTTEFVAAKSPDSKKYDTSAPRHVHYALGTDPPIDLRFDVVRDPRLFEPGPRFFTDEYNLFSWADDDSPKKLADSVFDYVVSREASRLRMLGGDEERPETLDKTQLTDEIAGARVFGQSILPKHIKVEREGASSQFGRRTPFPTLQHLAAVAESFGTTLSSITYLGPLRSLPERHYLASGGSPTTVGTHGDDTPRILFRKPEITKQINQWFESFEIPYRLLVKPLGDEVTGDLFSIHLVDRHSGVSVSPSDVGFGIWQFLPVIVEGLIGTGRILCVEQPEIHLHPRLQAHVADLLIQTYEGMPMSLSPRGGGRGRSARSKRIGLPGTQWIVETHSEPLILRLQRRIREGELRHTDVSVLYVEPRGKSGSHVLRLRLDEDGEFVDEWPDGFFEEGFRERFGWE